MSLDFREEELFDAISFPVARGVLGARPARVLLFEHSVLVCARNFHELLRIEPGRRPGGEMGLLYSLRSPVALARRLRVLAALGKEPSRDTKGVPGGSLGTNPALA